MKASPGAKKPGRRSLRAPTAPSGSIVATGVAALGVVLLLIGVVLLLLGAPQIESKRPTLEARIEELKRKESELDKTLTTELKKASDDSRELGTQAGKMTELQSQADMMEHRFRVASSGASVAAMQAEKNAAEDELKRLQRDIGDRTANASPAQIIARLQKCVGVVRTDVGVGSGFLIDGSGLFVTNYHVVAGSSKVTVTLQKSDKQDKVVLESSVVAADVKNDLALLKLPSPPEGIAINSQYPIVRVRRDPALRAGEAVTAIGNPAAGLDVLDFTVTTGVVSNPIRKLGELEFIQTSAPVNPGNSGGPLLDSAGQLVGVVVAKGVGVEGITFAIPVARLSNFLGGAQQAPLTVKSTLSEWEKEHNPAIGLSNVPPDLQKQAIALDSPCLQMLLSADGKIMYLLMGGA
ncbi:MAG TPA: trypsin-like peptidase domain-containing protein, partial [Planctomycetota bacterium]|nr:trypsin-like peptidase domain-containing protein [Planctomycetota bacterium]